MMMMTRMNVNWRQPVSFYQWFLWISNTWSHSILYCILKGNQRRSATPFSKKAGSVTRLYLHLLILKCFILLSILAVDSKIFYSLDC